MGLGGGGGIGAPDTETSSLVSVIEQTIDPSSWSVVGGNASIVEYNGLLVVKNSQTVHSKIKRLLDMMRSSIHSPTGRAPHAPGIGQPGAATGGFSPDGGGLPGGIGLGGAGASGGSGIEDAGGLGGIVPATGGSTPSEKRN